MKIEAEKRAFEACLDDAFLSPPSSSFRVGAFRGYKLAIALFAGASASSVAFTRKRDTRHAKPAALRTPARSSPTKKPRRRREILSKKKAPRKSNQPSKHLNGARSGTRRGVRVAPVLRGGAGTTRVARRRRGGCRRAAREPDGAAQGRDTADGHGKSGGGGAAACASIQQQQQRRQVGGKERY